MREQEFRYWLAHHTELTDDAQKNALSRCRRVERYEGDLDQYFFENRLRDLLDRLSYGTEDEACHAPPSHSIPINGNIRNGTASLSSAVRTYKQFCNACSAPIRDRPSS
jgi:hypothetical protein